MIYLGIYNGHNASAALMQDGKIIYALQEERFTNLKNFYGYPAKSIEYCLEYVKSKNLIIDIAAFSNTSHPLFFSKYRFNNFFNISDFDKFYSISLNKEKAVSFVKNHKKCKKNKGLYLPFDKLNQKYYFNGKFGSSMLEAQLKKQAKQNIKKIIFLDHHTCHAYYSYFSAKNRKDNSCVVSVDSYGDGANQTVWIVKKNKLKLVARTDQFEIARIYKFITLILNMKPEEHEFKVMGLSAYSKKRYILDVYKKIFKNIQKFNGIKIVHNKRPKNLYKFLKESTKNTRFDNIAGGLQYFVEKVIKDLLIRINKKYKVENFYFSGGVAMNVKMYNSLGKLNFVNYLYSPPSGSDESLSIGACYYLSQNVKTHSLNNIYLGKNLVNRDVKLNLGLIKKKFSNNNYKITSNFSHKDLASLLIKNEIIAVARGREEFGARALGNRSIIANPSNFEVVQNINESIKNRDFWMPFALTILKEQHKEYIDNKKNFECNYMTMSFDTKKNNFNKIKAGCHPYDKTVRPQILDKDSNPDYYSIIQNFFKKTGIPALLNTSLNLHGNPVASSLDNVIYTFKRSGLKYLYLNDNFLIKKK
ncbi:carbamoyltransferase C-terminal domain-containing protein [Pelagibacteraceae bacterium]|jgi:carbamoyltransferase|nr:carbamoyltransferase C-terminal domain-containing protein [Pelagibacteraceae bacterium]